MFLMYHKSHVRNVHPSGLHRFWNSDRISKVSPMQFSYLLYTYIIYKLAMLYTYIHIYPNIHVCVLHGALLQTFWLKRIRGFPDYVFVFLFRRFPRAAASEVARGIKAL